MTGSGVGIEERPPLRVLFVTQYDFSKPAEMHVLGFAEELTRLGHRVMVSMGGDPASASVEGLSISETVLLWQHRFRGPRLTAKTRAWAKEFDPDVIHAWNPRVPTVCAARDYARATGAPYLVHFEDDEWTPWPTANRRFRSRVSLLGRRRLWRLYPPLWGHSAPRSLAWARDEAAGLDALTPELAKEVRARLSRACSVVLPVMPPKGAVGAGESRLGRKPGEHVVLFSGRVLPTSLPDFTCAIEAVASLRRRGLPVRLAQTGAVSADLDIEHDAKSLGLERDAVSFLGHIQFADVLPTLRDADVLIQPGPPSRFNRLRLPSKLQNYLESGTPTITFAVGAGELLRDGEDVLLTHTDDPEELAQRIEAVLTDHELRDRLASGAIAASRRLFDGPRNTMSLLEYYRESLVTRQARS